MDGGHIRVARALPIDAALVGDVLVRLRRDTAGSTMSWTLGDRGSAELDVDFFPVFFGFVSETAGPAWTTTARLWDPQAVAVVLAVVELSAVSTDTCELTIRPDFPLTPWWAAHTPALVKLATSALDEVAEELLWQATRDGVAARRVN
ncbi:MAG: hypothetical protein ACLPVY_25145 [Acidimicrobiia bacterium]